MAAFVLPVIGSLCNNVNLMMCSAVYKRMFQTPKMMLSQMSLKPVGVEHDDLSHDAAQTLISLERSPQTRFNIQDQD